MHSNPPIIPPRAGGWLCFTLLALFVIFAGCKTAEDKNPTSSHGTLTISVEAQPSAILANGASRLVVFTQVTEGGDFAADSTEVILLNTMGTLQRGVLYTHNGVALDTLTSDTVAGTGWIIAYARGVRDSTEIMFTR
jgi:hypothetical protein